MRAPMECVIQSCDGYFMCTFPPRPFLARFFHSFALLRAICCPARSLSLACSIPIGTTTFPNQLLEALLAANVGALGVVLGKSGF